MKKELKEIIRLNITKLEKLLRSLGFEIKKYPSSEHLRRINIVKKNAISIILDVGANEGQYLESMRELGYKGKIICFEPLESAYKKLKIRADKDLDCQTFNYALGNENSRSLINVSNNSQSSSISEILPLHLESAPSSEFLFQQKIEIKTLDSIFESITVPSSIVMLKIDVQGFEKMVLEGALKSLDKIKVIQVEMSLFPLYKDSALYDEMIDYLEAMNYKLFSIEDVFSNSITGQLLQIDGIFVKEI